MEDKEQKRYKSGATNVLFFIEEKVGVCDTHLALGYTNVVEIVSDQI